MALVLCALLTHKHRCDIEFSFHCLTTRSYMDSFPEPQANTTHANSKALFVTARVEQEPFRCISSIYISKLGPTTQTWLNQCNLFGRRPEAPQDAPQRRHYKKGVTIGHQHIVDGFCFPGFLSNLGCPHSYPSLLPLLFLWTVGVFNCISEISWL